MPLVPYTKSDIEIAVSDRIYSDTIIKQKAKFTALHHTQDENGSRVAVTVLVTMYANDNGEYSQELTGQGFKPYYVTLIADNNCLVNVADGAILAIRSIETIMEWQAVATAYEQAVMWQGDFFEMVRETQSINIGALIRQHITAADAIGKFK
jgi:hypothetical protein